MQGLSMHELGKLYDAEHRRFVEGQEEVAQMATD